MAGLLVCCGSALYALQSGDKALPLEVAPLPGESPVRLSFDEDDSNAAKNLVAINFFESWTPLSRQSIMLLNELQARYQDKNLQIMAISAEKPEGVLEFRKSVKDLRIRLLLDKDNRTSKAYLTNNTILPHVVLVNGRGEVLWSGEAFDLENVLIAVYDGKFDLKQQKRCAELLEKMKLALESGRMALIPELAQKVLAIDGANTEAARMMLFALENGNNRGENGWNFLADLIKRNPKELKWRLWQIDWMLRYPEYTVDLDAAVSAVVKDFSASGVQLLDLGYVLLTQFQYNGAAIIGTKQILDLVRPEFAKLSDSEQARYKFVESLYCYKLGRLADAVSSLQAALKTTYGADNKEYEQLMKYYELLQKQQK